MKREPRRWVQASEGHRVSRPSVREVWYLRSLQGTYNFNGLGLQILTFSSLYYLPP